MPSNLPRIFKTESRHDKIFTWGDIICLFLIAVLIFFGVRLAVNAPEFIQGPQISLSPGALPWYAFLSFGRMLAAYILSLLFSLFYGRAAAYNRNAEKILMPLLDVLQSVPILSFLPVVLLSLSAILPIKIAAELASIVLIFTSQAWNLTFAWYQSLTTIPKDLHEASSIFRLNTWLKFKKLELPFGTISLIWNSIMSWAGGWFFLMAAEIFTVGSRDFRLPGIGAYLQEAANQSNFQAILWGIGTLILLIVGLDQFIWRPLLAWSDRFKVEMVENDNPPTSWFYDLLKNANLINKFQEKIVEPISERIDLFLMNKYQVKPVVLHQQKKFNIKNLLFVVFAGILVYGIYQITLILISIPILQWKSMGSGILMTTLRVFIALLIALGWTIPVGVAIGTNQRLSAIVQPFVQVAASIPATALFPILLLTIIDNPGGLNTAAVLLMLLGTQWYLLFNIIAGASAIPQDLKYTATILQMSRWQRWKILILPSIFPYLITGAITASGGAWNASIVAEYVHFGGETLQTTGIGALISSATASGDYHLLLASTISMVVTVILINRLLWRRLYNIAENNYRME
jgi:NitT/TauT family transport system permease protein